METDQSKQEDKPSLREEREELKTPIENHLLETAVAQEKTNITEELISQENPKETVNHQESKEESTAPIEDANKAISEQSEMPATEVNKEHNEAELNVVQE